MGPQLASQYLLEDSLLRGASPLFLPDRPLRPSLLCVRHGGWLVASVLAELALLLSVFFNADSLEELFCAGSSTTSTDKHPPILDATRDGLHLPRRG